MWQRFLRLLATSFSAYSFYSNPLKFIVSIVCVVLIPYLAYIFWGTLIIVALAIAGVYFIFRAIKSSYSNSTHHY